MPMSSPTTRRMSATSAAVAPPGTKPVEVFTKSAAAAFASVHAVTFSSSVNNAVSMMTLLRTFDSRHARRHGENVALHEVQIARLQRADVDDHVDLAARRRRSRAVSRTASCPRSWHRAGIPRPSTRPRRSPSPGAHRWTPRSGSRRRWQSRTADASRQSVSISAFVASGFRSVWSIIPATSPAPPPDRMEPEACRTRLDDGRHSTGAALVEHRVAGASNRRPCRCRRQPTPRR